MPVVDYKTYCHMLDNARNKGFAYPAINVTSMTSANATFAKTRPSTKRKEVKTISFLHMRFLKNTQFSY